MVDFELFPDRVEIPEKSFCLLLSTRVLFLLSWYASIDSVNPIIVLFLSSTFIFLTVFVGFSLIIDISSLVGELHVSHSMRRACVTLLVNIYQPTGLRRLVICFEFFFFTCVAHANMCLKEKRD